MLVSAMVCFLAVATVDLEVESVSPAPNTTVAMSLQVVTFRFDRAVDPGTVDQTSFRVFGRWSGPTRGNIRFSDDDHTVSLVPKHPFSAGEQVFVNLSHHVRAKDGSAMRAAGYAFSFWVRSFPATMDFQPYLDLSTNASSAESSRPYGGIASDLNRDGWLDVTLINEDTADVRVFMNAGEGNGRLEPFTQPTFPANLIASPSEPGDFNGDGLVDLCLTNRAANTLSVLLGNGDGTFAPQQQISVGQAPLGIAVLDVDGDGDGDIVNANSGSDNMSVLRNDGLGNFGPPTYFEGGGLGERALSATDMNGDGITDLVIGARTSESIVVRLGNGDGTFTQSSVQSAGGQVWMLVTGDVNGDGFQDVATANSAPAQNGAILFGDGAGGLANPVTYGTDLFPLATDLADLDGDGDLDWVVSNFGDFQTFGGSWMIFRNDGSGGFSFFERIDAPAAASCSLPFDADNDGDLDLALIDEIDDRLLLLKNSGSPATTQLLYPWVSNRQGDFHSVVVANNFGADEVEVHLTARRADGAEETTARLIPARGFLQADAAELFPDLGSGSGYAVTLTAFGPKVQGRWVTHNLQAASGQSPSQGVAVDLSEGSAAKAANVGRNLLFGYLPTEEPQSAVPVIVNVGDAPTDLSLYFYNPEGELQGQEPITVAQLQPFLPLPITELPEGETAANLYLVARSADQPLAGAAFIFNEVFFEPAIGNATAIDFEP